MPVFARLNLLVRTLIDNLFLSFGHYAYRQCIGRPCCAVYGANFYCFSCDFHFLKYHLKSNTCPNMFQRLSPVCRSINDHFVQDLLVFESFIYLHKDFFGGFICPNMSSELNCTSRGFSFSFLDCRGLFGEIFDKSTQPEYAGMDMICMPHVHFQYLYYC